jgi:hypothetical protein
MPVTINTKLNLKACINVANTVLCSPLISVTTVGCQAYGFNSYALSPYPGILLGHKNAPYLGGTGKLTKKKYYSNNVDNSFFLTSLFTNDEDGGWMILQKKKKNFLICAVILVFSQRSQWNGLYTN